VASRHNSAYANAGWSFSESAIGLALGTHTVSAVVHDASSLSTLLGTATITVTAAPVPIPPFGLLGKAVDARTGLTTVEQGDNLLVAGWAADVQEGAPVYQVAILIDGALVGNATLGIPKPAVVTKYGKPAYLDSGWTFTEAASGLAVGDHTVRGVAYDALGLSTVLGTALITVTP
jgi:hypothetical protein